MALELEPRSPARYLNREWSWLQFNNRVLQESIDLSTPLLERIKYLAIFESNLDEFYMVRVSGLIEQEEAGMSQVSPDGLDASEQLGMIAGVAAPLRSEAAAIWREQIRPALEAEKIHLVSPEELTEEEERVLAETYDSDIFPLLTPLMMESSPSSPFISNRSLNLAVQLHEKGTYHWARIKIPPVLKRLIPIPGREDSFVLLEDAVASHLQHLFPGVDIVSSYLFRVIRDADIEIRELEAADLIDAVEKTLRLRRFGDPVLLEIEADAPEELIELLQTKLELAEVDTFRVHGRLGMEFLWELSQLNRPELKYPEHQPYRSEILGNAETLFERIRRDDLLLHLPYDDFLSVETFIAAAASDPKVVGIKQTLYRVGSESPIIQSLLHAAEEGKQVTAMVELKARFDESNNLTWSRTLERSGVHVTYGTVEMKVHCKLCLIIRKEDDGIQTYAHIGTGNYNPVTAKLYTDLAVFTADPEICQDITELFNYLTGLSRQVHYRKLLVAPLELREGIVQRIEREILCHRNGQPARIIFKLNSLVDTEVIDALYQASQEGVPVDLIVRGICCLRPGVKNLSENIRAVSIVGRFLEHSRVYYFHNGGDSEALIGSADMMRRNLDRRIEVLVPITSTDLIRYIKEEVLDRPLADNQKAWIGMPNGDFEKIKKSGRTRARSSQDELMARPATQLID